MSASPRRLYSRALASAILLSLFAAGQVLPGGGVRTAQAAGTVTVSFPAVAGAGVFNAQFSTQDVWPNWFPNQPAGTGGTGIYDRLAALNAPFFRVHAGTDGSWGPISGPNSAGGGQSPALPFPTAFNGTGGGSAMNIPAWDFSQLNLLLPSTHDSGSGGTVTYGGTTVTDTSKSWQPGLWVNRKVSVGSQSRTVSSNTATTITLKSSWSPTPSAGTAFSISSAIGSTPVLMDVRYLPDVMYGGACGSPSNQLCPIGGGRNSPGGIADQTYAGYASYMAALVGYFNKGVSPSGAFPSASPPGAGPIKYWEIYNEPDFAAENPRIPPTINVPSSAGVTISGVNVPGGTLTPGTTYTYELTATTVPGVETPPSAPISILLPAGDNAVRLQFSRAISQTLSKIPPGYRIYGRSGTAPYLGFIGRDTATTVCPGGPDCLTWTDAGTSAPDGSSHPPASNGTGYEAPFSPLEYKKMWDVVIPAMKAVDPTIKVIGPGATNTQSISPNSIVPNAITTGPSDNSWQDNRDYVQVLMTSSNKPDMVSFHQYGGFQGTETEQQMLDNIDLPGASSVSMYQGLQNNILPYVGNTPLIQTETGVNANQLAGTTAYKTAAIKGFGAAWFGHLVARLGALTPNLQSTFQFQFLESPTLGAVAMDSSLVATPGDPYLNYWLMATLNARVPQGSKLLSVSGTPSGMDIVAVAIPPSYTTVEVMVVNRQPAATCCSGLPQSTTVSLSSAGSTQTNLWMVDDLTLLANGPSASNLGTSTSVNVNFANGYGVAFVEFMTGLGVTVASVLPNTGPTAGGTSVTITGTNFTGATAVKFGTATATFTVTSATQITATSPPGSGTVDVTVTGPIGTSAISAADRFTYTAPPAAYIAQSPNRILDTRLTAQTLSGGGSLNLTVAGGTTGVPATATGVVLNVTVTNTSAPSFLKVGPAGAAAATVSNLNWVAGETRANLVNVPVGTGGQISIFNGVGSADVVVDAEGYFAAPVGTAGGYNALPPQRLLDTRSSGQTMSTGGAIDLQVLGAGGVPATGVSAVVLNATATKTATQGYFTIYPSGTTRPTASNVNWAAGWTLPNLVIVKVGSNGKVSIYNGQGASDAVIDVSGYFTDSTASGKLFVPLTPARVLDTRVSGGTIGPNGTMSNFQITGNNGVPSGATAVFLNTTVTNTTASSALTVFPGPTKPTASDLNWIAGQTIPNLTLATLSSTGATSFYNFVGSTDLVLDLSGYFS